MPLANNDKQKTLVVVEQVDGKEINVDANLLSQITPRALPCWQCHELNMFDCQKSSEVSHDHRPMLSLDDSRHPDRNLWLEFISEQDWLVRRLSQSAGLLALNIDWLATPGDSDRRADCEFYDTTRAGAWSRIESLLKDMAEDVADWQAMLKEVKDKAHAFS